MRNFLILPFLFLACWTYSQVGINNVLPKSTLDISAVNSTSPMSTEGLLIPRINSFPLINPTAEQNSMLVYLSAQTAAGSPFGINSPGFYYWNFPQLTWVALDSSKLSWLINGNSSTIEGTHFLGTTDNIPLNFRINNEKSGRIHQSQTFFGYRSGNSNSGNFNNGLGDNALYTNSTGNNNTAFGSSSLFKNSTGNENTALGNRALHENTTAVGNTAVGYEALFSSTASGENVAVGYQALKNNNTDSNTAVGYQSLFQNINGNSNTAVGRGSLRNTVNGSSNTAVGRESLESNISGGNNSAFGTQALRSTTVGNDNTSMGAYSLYSNIGGSGNSSFGINSLYRNLSGENNIGVGKESLYNNTLGNFNVALGFASLYDNISGNENVAIGPEAARDNMSGSRNVAIGHDASRTNISGSGNVAVGNFALLNNMNGSNNTAVGNNADVSATNINNSTALGNGAKVNLSNKVRIGNENITVIEGQVALSVASDRRYKEKIALIPLGLAFIKELIPVEYIKKNDAEQRMEWGLIAQDVKKTLEKNNYHNAALITNDHSKDNYLSIRYNDLLAPMIKSIQELAESNTKNKETMQKVIADQEMKITELSSKLEALEKKLNELIPTT